MDRKKQDVLNEGLDIDISGFNQALLDSYGDALQGQYVVGDAIPDQVSFSATHTQPYTGNGYTYRFIQQPAE